MFAVRVGHKGALEGWGEAVAILQLMYIITNLMTPFVGMRR